MSFEFKATKSAPKPIPVNLPDGQSFTLLVKRMSGLDMMKFSDCERDRKTEYLIRSTVAGWEGVTDGKNPVPFTIDALLSLFEANPLAYAVVESAAWAEHSKGLDVQKKVEPPTSEQPVDTSPATASA